MCVKYKNILKFLHYKLLLQENITYQKLKLFNPVTLHQYTSNKKCTMHVEYIYFEVSSVVAENNSCPAGHLC